MLQDRLQVYTLGIVFLGDFNPIIIQPFWLASKGLIRDKEAEDTKVKVMHNDLVTIELDWAEISVTRQRFEVKTQQEPYFEAIRDLCVSIFRILGETPIRAVGINHGRNYSMRDGDTYYEFGNQLAPLQNWKGILTNPKLATLEILDKRNDGLDGSCRIRVTPSNSNLGIGFGVAIDFNDHYDILNEKKARGSEAVKILAERWPTSFKYSNDIIEGMWDKIKK